MTYDEIKTAWNAQADEHNQWDNLGEDEKIEWAASSAAAKERAARQAAQTELAALKAAAPQPDHFRGVTKMMPPERACTRSHPHEKQSAVCDLQEVTDWLRHFAAGGLSISVEKATQYAAQVERVAKALKAPAILDADEIVALAAQLATGAADNLADQLNGQVKVAQLCKDAIEQIRARVEAANAQLQHAKATVCQLTEEMHEQCRLLGASAEKELALHARVQELEAKAKVRLSIPPVQLPEPDINTANHAGVRVIGYTPQKVCDLLATQAFNQPLTAQVPPFTTLAQRKLDDLLAQGFRITGYAIERTDVADWAPQRGFVTHGGLVGWWTPHQIDRIPGAQHGQPT